MDSQCLKKGALVLQRVEHGQGRVYAEVAGQCGKQGAIISLGTVSSPLLLCLSFSICRHLRSTQQTTALRLQADYRRSQSAAPADRLNAFIDAVPTFGKTGKQILHDHDALEYWLGEQCRVGRRIKDGLLDFAVDVIVAPSESLLVLTLPLHC